MSDNRTSAPALSMGNSHSTSQTDTRTKHAKATAYACGFLALLIFIVNAWLVIEGIQSTEPASEARYAHIAQSVLLALIEFSLFAISGLFPEFKNSFRAIGILILTLEIGLMSISQISTGLTAGKVAARSEDVVAQLKAKADISLNQIKMAQETAKNLNSSKHGWRHEQAAQQTNLAAVQSKSAASDVERLEAASTTGAAVSTPMVEIIGKNGLIALSIALAFGLSIAGIALTHCMGSLIRSGVMPIDLQILELLHKVHGSPVAAPVSPVATVATVATPSISYGKMLAGAGALAALSGAPITHAAPAPVNVDTPAPATPVNVDTPAPATPVNVDTPAPVRARMLNGVVMDTGIGEHDGYRFRRALEGIKANTIRLSIDGLYAGVKASRPTAKRYIKAWADAGEIERNEDDTAWILAVKKVGAA